jgi:hypothetical protein
VNLPEDSFTHPDARGARIDALWNSIRTHQGATESDVDSIIDDTDLLDELDNDFDARSCESTQGVEYDDDENLSDSEDENQLDQKPKPVCDESSSSKDDEDPKQTRD